MKKFFIVIAVLCLGAIFATCLANRYVGSIRSGVFHYTNCKWANRINYKNKVYYNTRDEYLRKGYRSCHVCNP